MTLVDCENNKYNFEALICIEMSYFGDNNTFFKVFTIVTFLKFIVSYHQAKFQKIIYTRF